MSIEWLMLSSSTSPVVVRESALMILSIGHCQLLMADCWKIDVFELWCWRRLLRVPWTARRSNQSILMEISPEYSLEGLMVKLKLQYFGHLMQRTNFLEKTLMLGKIESGRRRDNRGWDGWMASPMRWTWVCMSLGVGDGQGSLASCSLWGLKESVSDWTELKLEKDSVTTTGLTMDGVIGVMWTVSNNWEQISADNQQRSRNFRTIHAKHWFCQQSDGTWNVAPSQSLQTRPQPSQHLDFSTSWDLKQRSQLRAPGTSTQRSNLHLQHLLHCKQILYHCAPWKALQSG